LDIYTAGFTKHTAAEFFESLKSARIDCLIDVRLNNTSQVAGFAKRDDLRYFLDQICGAAYIHEPLLAPSQQLLDAYKKEKGSWEAYEQSFFELMAERRVEIRVPRELFAGRTMLLCSEPTAEHCHRRLVVEYLKDRWGDVSALHL
jgi:uncharacterized protein (DUF488 family)